jgi:hypothetical protein
MMAGTKSQKVKKWLPTAPEGNQDSNKSNVSANGKDDSMLPASSVAAKKDSAGIKVVTPTSSPKGKSKAEKKLGLFDSPPRARVAGSATSRLCLPLSCVRFPCSLCLQFPPPPLFSFS